MIISIKNDCLTVNIIQQAHKNQVRIAKSNKYINIQKSFWTHFGNEHAFNIMRVSVWIYVVARVT